MLTKTQEKLILTLKTSQGRKKANRCLVEGQKNIDVAGDAIMFTFTPDDTGRFTSLVTTDTPQTIAGVARIPDFTEDDIITKDTIVVLDGVQDPGNVGGILRLCLGFDASLLMIESADVTNSKVVRSSAGSLFRVPWMRIARDSVEGIIAGYQRPVYRLEKNPNATTTVKEKKCIIIAGSEGAGIVLKIAGKSVMVPHSKALESLNVSHALAIALAQAYRAIA